MVRGLKKIQEKIYNHRIFFSFLDIRHWLKERARWSHYSCCPCPVKGLISSLWQTDRVSHMSTTWMCITSGWKGSSEWRVVENTEHPLRLPSGEPLAFRLYPYVERILIIQNDADQINLYVSLILYWHFSHGQGWGTWSYNP